MAETQIAYDIATQIVSGKVDVARLIEDIRLSNVSVSLAYPNGVMVRAGTTLFVIFKDDPSVADRALLDGGDEGDVGALTIIGSHSGIEFIEPDIVRLAGPTERDQRAVVIVNPASKAFKAWFTSAGDAPAAGAAVDQRGNGVPIRLDFTQPDDKSVEFQFTEMVEIHNGQMNWGPVGDWNADDWFALSIRFPATPNTDANENGNASLFAMGGGRNAYVPRSGTGGVNINLSTAVPIPTVDEENDGQWEFNHDTGEITPASPRGTGNCDLVDFEPEKAYILAKVLMGNNDGVMNFNAYKARVLHTNWRVVFDCHKATAGSGTISGWLMMFRMRITRDPA